MRQLDDEMQAIASIQKAAHAFEAAVPAGEPKHAELRAYVREARSLAAYTDQLASAKESDREEFAARLSLLVSGLHAGVVIGGTDRPAMGKCSDNWASCLKDDPKLGEPAWQKKARCDFEFLDCVFEALEGDWRRL